MDHVSRELFRVLDPSLSVSQLLWLPWDEVLLLPHALEIMVHCLTTSLEGEMPEPLGVVVSMGSTQLSSWLITPCGG